MTKIGDKRKSERCPPFCEAKGCYDRYEKIMDGSGWVSYCKSIRKLHKQII